MKINYLKTTEELFSIYSLIQQHHTHMKDADFNLLLEEMKETGYQCVGAYEEDRLVATVGF